MLGSLLSETSIFSEVVNFGIYLRTQFFDVTFGILLSLLTFNWFIFLFFNCLLIDVCSYYFNGGFPEK